MAFNSMKHDLQVNWLQKQPTKTMSLWILNYGLNYSWENKDISIQEEQANCLISMLYIKVLTRSGLPGFKSQGHDCFSGHDRLLES